MKKFTPETGIKSAALYFCCALLFPVLLHAQITTQPLPKKWVSKYQSKERKGELLERRLNPNRSKAEIISDKIPGQELRFYYPKEAIAALIQKMKESFETNTIDTSEQYVNIYFALDKNLKIIFAPAKKKKPECAPVDLGSYFEITSNGLETDDPAKIPGWLTNYYSTVLLPADGLNSTVAPEDTNDNFSCLDSVYSDTKSEFYSYADFFEFIMGEINYQQTNQGPDIKGIEVDLASYTSTGNRDHRFKYRTILQFEYVIFKRSGKHKIFYLDRQRGFSNRYNEWRIRYPHPDDQLHSSAKSKKNKRNKGNDNGQLCPPNCPR